MRRLSSCLRSVNFSVRKSFPSDIKRSKAKKQGSLRWNSRSRNCGLPRLSRHTISPSKTVLPTYGNFNCLRSVSNDLKELPLREMSSVRPFWITASERKPSYFSSKIHSGWSKGRGLRDNGMGWNATEDSVSEGVAKVGRSHEGARGYFFFFQYRRTVSVQGSGVFTSVEGTAHLSNQSSSSHW